jgi:hypothetical protein
MELDERSRRPSRGSSVIWTNDWPHAAEVVHTIRAPKSTSGPAEVRLNGLDDRGGDERRYAPHTSHPLTKGGISVTVLVAGWVLRERPTAGNGGMAGRRVAVWPRPP